MAIRVLMINHQLSFAVTIKQALEQTGRFTVVPFTAADAALDYLPDHPQDVALVDFTLPDMGGAELVYALRSVQPDIVVIASPQQPDPDVIQETLRLQGMVDAPFNARDVIPLIERALGRTPSTAAYDSQRFERLIDSVRTPLPERQYVELVLTGGMDEAQREIERSQAELPAPEDEEAVRRFQELAQEEPPLPGLESGTVSDLIVGVSDPGFRNAGSARHNEDTPPEEHNPQQPDNPEATMPTAEPETGREVLPEEAEDPAQLRSIPRRDAEPDEDEADELDRPIPARLILESAQADYSLDKLIANIEHNLKANQPTVQPLPSWLRERKVDPFSEESRPFVREPDFLPDNAIQWPEPDQVGGFTEQTTPSASQNAPAAQTQDWDTDSYDTPARARPSHEAPPVEPEAAWEQEDEAPEFTPLPKPEQEEPVPESHDEEPQPVSQIEMPEEAQADEWDVSPEDSAPFTGDEIREHEAAFDELAADTQRGAILPEAEVPPPPPPPPRITYQADDPSIAQLALSLTQASLELAAAATLLTRGNEILAYAGQLAEADIQELRETIGDDWQTGPQEARIRFITLKGSGRDYMLYSRRTEGDFTLSMIFAGAMPLRVIRRQGQRLIDALRAVPEVQLEEAAPEAPVLVEELPEVAQEEAALALPPAAVVAVPLTAFSYVWLLRDPNAYLDEEVSQVLAAGLQFQFVPLGWQFRHVEVREDHVYLMADVPGDTPAHQVVRELKRRSAEIVHAHRPALDPATLWSDGYLIVTPGRELEVEEIQEFINFQRMP